MRLTNAVAIITGGGSGIGQGIATRFAAAGARVVIGDRHRAGAEATARAITDDGGEAIAVEMDVTDQAAIARMVGRGREVFGPISHLVNNAGLAVGDDVATITPDDWDLNLDVVLKGTFLCTQAVLAEMVAQRRGNILNIASVNGMYGIGEAAYSAAKAGVINLTRNLAVRYGADGIRANVISPGSIRTPIWDQRVTEEPEVFTALADWYPLGRVGTIDDVAQAALFLASDDAAWITGVNLPVDGGLTAGNHRFARALRGDSESA